MDCTGKLPPELLKRHVFNFRGVRRSEVVTGPGIGEDAAVIRLGRRRYLLASTDPIVGAGEEDSGRFLVEINVNDIAVKGGDPLYLLVTLLVPQRLGVEYISRCMKEIHKACRCYGIAVIGGHTELSGEIDKPLISGTIIGKSRRLFTMQKARTGDIILLAGEVAIEGAYLIYMSRKDELQGLLTPEEEAEVLSYKERLSVYPYSKLIRDDVLFMHDPTEGGIMGGLAEFDALLNDGAVLWNGGPELRTPVKKICEALSIDPGHLISSGALLALVPAGKIEKVERKLHKASFPCHRLGEIAREGNVPGDFREELWPHLQRKP